MARERASLLPIAIFFGLTYVVTWTSFLVAAMISGSAAATPVGPVRLMVLTGVFAPSLVALALTAREGGSAAVVALLRRLIQWRVPFRWYLFAGLFVVTIKLSVALIHRAVLGAWPRFGHEGWITMVAATILSVLLAGQTGEEIVWRGYALPRLSSRFGFAWAILILGVMWACWHLPLFFM